MLITFETVVERDIDLLIIEEFACDLGFVQIFLDEIGFNEDYKIERIIHSKTDSQFGESDIVVILRSKEQLHALHIENKISALAMPNQSERYHKRAQKDIARGEYHSYSVLITAPQRYLKNNTEAQKYEYSVSYEKLLEYFDKRQSDRAAYKRILLKRAITAQKSGYQWKENPYVASFCKAMYAYQRERFPGLPIGTVAWWPTYKTIHEGIDVCFKANKGHCDLEFKCTQKELYAKYNDKIYGAMTIERTGKSSAIRIAVKPIYFEKGFENAVSDVEQALRAIQELISFANNL